MAKSNVIPFRKAQSYVISVSLETGYYQLLHTYAMAAVNLYGIIPTGEFIEIFNSQNVQQTDLQEVLTALRRSMLSQEALYCLWNDDDYLVHQAA